MAIRKEEPIIQLKWLYVSNNRISNEKNCFRKSSSKHGSR
jgi:hypothetical protein